MTFKELVNLKKDYSLLLHRLIICDENLGYIHSDKLRIKQIIKNLLSNALKFTMEGKITFEVKVDDNNFIIKIKDTGIGIEKDKITNIFDRFKQADSSTTRKFGGTGLGLSICKELTSLLGGEILVESELNIGSTFTVLIPTNKDKINTKAIELESKDTKIKENILVLNTDTLSFLHITIELKKSLTIHKSIL